MSSISFRHLFAASVFSLAIGNTAVVASQPPADEARFSLSHIFSPEVSREGMVVSEEEIASRVGADILANGGNAVDAAVAVGIALAVVLPEAGNLGGGGFMVIHLAKDNKNTTIDYREMAPGKAHRDMFLNADGSVNRDELSWGWSGIGVPGTVAGLSMALDKYGTMKWADVVKPAIALARNGFIMKPAHEESFQRAEQRLGRFDESKKIFLDAKGKAKPFGSRLVQKDLAWSLTQLAEKGPNAFYQGEIGKRLVADIQANGGVMTMEDLANYRAVEREALLGDYRGYQIVSMPPPSSGGVHLVQMLNVLEGFDLSAWGLNSANTIHAMIETERRAYADRAEYLGDPDFYNVPVKQLTSKQYAEVLRAQINMEKATLSSDVKPGNLAPYESPQTTHYSVMDKHGNAVANTYTLNWSYGTGITAKGTGILLNNQMDDFSAKPGAANAYGLVGADANAVEPKKRPLSSMTPTIVMKNGKVFMVTGSPGGSTIITTVLQTIVNVIDHGMNIQAASNQPRFHHQWLPDRVRFESGFSADTLQILKARGHHISVGSPLGTTESIMHINGLFYGAADPRRAGGGAIGPEYHLKQAN